MRRALLICLMVAGCGDNNAAKLQADASPSNPPHDAKEFLDAKEYLDAPPHVDDGIAAALATPNGTNLTLPITGVTVTYVRPTVVGASTTNDPAGFYVQADQTGPALYVSVDPTTTTPPLVPGDVVSFTITEMGTPAGMQRRALAIDALTRSSQGASTTALTQNVSAATDLVTAVGDYDAELVAFDATLANDATTSGASFSAFQITTTGITTPSTSLVLRMPTTLVTSSTISKGCSVHVTAATLNRFNASAEPTVFNQSDFTFTCPMTVTAATALSATSVKVTFSRNVDATTATDATLFTADNGLTFTGVPVVATNTVTLVSSSQTPGQTYTVTAPDTIKSTDNTALSAPKSATFTGFQPPATLRINELNANIAGGCDLIELRVITGGSIGGFTVSQRITNLATLPNIQVAKNDLIVIHENSGSATCNPGTSMTETTGINQYLQATYAANYDTAWDVWTTDGGITATNNVIQVKDSTGAIQDAVFLTDVSTTTIAADSLTAAGVVGTANQWSPAQATYTSADFLAAAVTDLNATANNATGTSIQRINDTDTNAKADWTTGAGVTQTFGALNAGQAALPVHHR